MQSLRTTIAFSVAFALGGPGLPGCGGGADVEADVTPEIVVRMPPVHEGVPYEQSLLPPIKIQVSTDDDGRTTTIRLGQSNLGTGENGLRRLNATVLQAIGGERSEEYAEEIEVEIAADPGLLWHECVAVISAVRGRWDTATSPPRLVPYIERVYFSPFEGRAEDLDGADARHVNFDQIELPTSTVAIPPGATGSRMRIDVAFPRDNSGGIVERTPRFRIDGEAMAFDDLRAELKRVSADLKSEGKLPHDVVIALRADREMRTGTVVRLVEAAREAQFVDFAIKAERPE